jgi:hypothetical protein
MSVQTPLMSIVPVHPEDERCTTLSVTPDRWFGHILSREKEWEESSEDLHALQTKLACNAWSVPFCHRCVLCLCLLLTKIVLGLAGDWALEANWRRCMR